LLEQAVREGLATQRRSTPASKETHDTTDEEPLATLRDPQTTGVVHVR